MGREEKACVRLVLGVGRMTGDAIHVDGLRRSQPRFLLSVRPAIDRPDNSASRNVTRAYGGQ